MREFNFNSGELLNSVYCAKDGAGVLETPRVVLIHHYQASGNSILTRGSLVVTTHEILNMAKMASRTYDPYNAFAMYFLPGRMPSEVNIYNHSSNLVRNTRIN